MKKIFFISLLLAFAYLVPGIVKATDFNNPGILEPVLTELTGMEVRIPNTDQMDGDIQLNVVGNIVSNSSLGSTSLLGNVITSNSSPDEDLETALKLLEIAVSEGDSNGMNSAANEIMDILKGNTSGRIYDGFSLLNYNRGAFVSDHLVDEYKMKKARDTGLTALGIDGGERKIWEVDVNMLWYGDEFDADTFLVRIPVEAHGLDTLRVNYKIYSLVSEEFSPTTVMVDKETSVGFPFKGFDSAWIPVDSDSVTEITLDHPPLQMLRGVYTWGWHKHPPRIHFLQPIFEITNAHTGIVELDPQGKSYAYRNRQLSIESIGDAAPGKKIYNVAKAVLDGATPGNVIDMLESASESLELLSNKLMLPQEAWDILAAEGITKGKFGPYQFVTVYMNNEMYGDGPRGASSIASFGQGDTVKVKVINLDNITHYYRNVDFGQKLNDDIAENAGNGSNFSFETFNFKPIYGVPKVAEMQWRAGWGFRPHFNVIQQKEVFFPEVENDLLSTFFDGFGIPRTGYQFSTEYRQGDFRFNPPTFIIGKSLAEPSAQSLQESDGSNGLVIGQLTEGYGVAKMCSNQDNPMGDFCGPIPVEFNPFGELNFPPPPSGMEATMLRFPPFLRNPNANGGDIIPPTPVWKPFLWINPNNGTLFIDPADHSKGFWSDLTYSHGTPVKAGTSLNADIEAPRYAGQVFYQFDELFHDNAMFSPHTSEITAPPTPGIKANGSDGPIDINTGLNLSVTVKLNPGDRTGEDADWWLVGETPFGWYHYDVLSDLWIPSLTVTFQGLLFNRTSPFTVLSMSGLPPGIYTFYFGVDMVMNGLLDMESIYYDSVAVTITE